MITKEEAEKRIIEIETKLAKIETLLNDYIDLFNVLAKRVNEDDAW